MTLTVHDQRAISAALAAVSPTRLSHLAESALVDGGTFLPVARVQWETILEDSDIAGRGVAVLKAIERIRDCLAGGPRAIGRRLCRRVDEALDRAEQLRDVGMEVLWFRPKDPADVEPVARLVNELPVYVADLVGQLLRGRSPDRFAPDPVVDAVESLIGKSGESDRGEVLRLVYGVPAEQLYGRSVGSPPAWLRKIFADRPEELREITSRVIAFAANGRKLINPLDPGLHPMSLVMDRRPWIGHHAARWACDLIHQRAAINMATTVGAVAAWFAAEQAGRSTHSGVQDLQARIHGPRSPDDEVRDVGNLYRMVVEGPLKIAAIGTLRLLGDTVPPAVGLNDLKIALLSRRTETPLCAAIAELINPGWRNAAAHEQLYWDPDRDQATLGTDPVDLEEMYDMADRAWSLGRGFHAGAAIAAGCLPDLNRQVDLRIGQGTPVGRDIQLVKIANQFGIVAEVANRTRTEVTLRVETLRGEHILTPLGALLLAVAASEPAIDTWTYTSSDDRPDFRVSARAIASANNLRGMSPQGDGAYLYPVTYAPLLTDALTQIGWPTHRALACAAGLIVRDSQTAIADACATKVWRDPHSCDHLREALRRSIRAVESLYASADKPVPPNHDLREIEVVLGEASRRPHDAHVLWRIGHYHRELVELLLDPEIESPWA